MSRLRRRKCAKHSTGAPNNMQNWKIEKLKSLGKDKCFQLAFENVNRVNSSKWWQQLVPRARSGHGERANNHLQQLSPLAFASKINELSDSPHHRSCSCIHLSVHARTKKKRQAAIRGGCCYLVVACFLTCQSRWLWWVSTQRACELVLSPLSSRHGWFSLFIWPVDRISFRR